MISYEITSALLGVVVAVTILMLVRRDHLHTRHAVWWIVLAASALFLGFFPDAVNRMGQALGVAYPPVLVMIVGLAILAIRILLQDIEHTRLEREVKRLTQQMAIWEMEKRSCFPEKTRCPPNNDRD